MPNPKDEKREISEQERTALLTWWNGLQQALDDGMCDIDLHTPEDTARLVVVDCELQSEDECDTTARYALDPERRPVDVKNITEEEIVERQQTENVSLETVRYLYEKAKAGRLL